MYVVSPTKRVNMEPPRRKKIIIGIIVTSSIILLDLVTATWIIVASSTKQPTTPSGELIPPQKFSSEKARVQSSLENTYRKTDLMTLRRAVETYRFENRGQLPVSNNLKTADLKRVTAISENGEPSETTVLYMRGTACNGTTSDKAFSLSIRLADSTRYCDGSR